MRLSSSNFVVALVALCSSIVLQDAAATEELSLPSPGDVTRPGDDSSQSSGLRFDAVFGDGMLLQRGQPLSVWGSGASPGAVAKVVLTVPGAPGATASTVAGPAGNWSVSLPAIPEALSSVLTVTCGSSTATLNDVAVGELLLCGGQSNMGFAMCATESATQTAQQALDALPPLRAFKWMGSGPGASGSCQTSAGARSESPVASWFTANASNAGTFSAVCLLTAQALYESLNGTVPVGAVESCVSGTSVERWMPPPSANFTPPWLPPCARQSCHGDLWRSGMVPLLPMRFAATVWDQGEADAKRSNASWYKVAWPAMIAGWRQGLQQPSLPFVYVELDSQMHDEIPHDAVDFWVAQREAASTLSKVGFATTTDIQRATHPPDKQDVAARLALEVRRVVWGQNIVSRGPELLSVTSTVQQQDASPRSGAELVLRFSNASLVSAAGILVNSSCTGKQPPKWCGQGCGGGNRADSLATDALTGRPLNYTLGHDGTVTVECADVNSAVRINSDSALCFLYAEKGTTNVPGGLMLPAPPVLVWCNTSGPV
jgi:sialate O-acetylesterase